MQKIIPHLWFDKEAKEAAELYVSVLPGSKINSVTTLRNTPSGDTDIVHFELSGMEFQAISAGPYFKFNPSVSFQIKCNTKEEVDRIWNKLSPGGTALMELGAYPFSERYGWLQDRYGLSWQIIYTGGMDMSQRIIPAIMFVGDVCGRAEEAILFWTSIFPDSKVLSLVRHGKDEGPDKEGTLTFSSFVLAGMEFGAMDSDYEHQFAFNEAISFIVKCKDQEEIDRYWSQLSAVPEAEQCGWLKDKFGFSWQVVPEDMDKMMSSGDQEKIDRVTQVFLPMKKLEIDKLREAYGE